MLLTLGLLSLLTAVPTPPVEIEVFVPLCDNALIVCGRSAAGDPRSLEANLYWGAAYGAERFLSRAPGFTVRSRSEGSPGSAVVLRGELVLERTPAKGERPVRLSLHAYAGDQIDTALEDFLRAAGGGSPADLVVWAGHDRLMDRVPPRMEPSTQRSPRPVAVLACMSEQYFGPVLQSLGAVPVVLTRTIIGARGLPPRSPGGGDGQARPHGVQCPAHRAGGRLCPATSASRPGPPAPSSRSYPRLRWWRRRSSSPRPAVQPKQWRSVTMLRASSSPRRSLGCGAAPRLHRQLEHLVEVAVVERAVPADRERVAAHHAAAAAAGLNAVHQALHVRLAGCPALEPLEEAADRHVGDREQRSNAMPWRRQQLALPLALERRLVAGEERARPGWSTSTRRRPLARRRSRPRSAAAALDATSRRRRRRAARRCSSAR